MLKAYWKRVLKTIKKHVEIFSMFWKLLKSMLKFQYVLKTVKKHVENFRIQVLKWSIPDAHPDSRVLSILKFSGIFENCMRGIFYSLKDTLLFKCSEFLILWSFWRGLHQMHIQMIESGIFRNRDQTVYA